VKVTSLLKLSRFIDFITEWTGRIFAWAIFLAIIVSCINALLRYFYPVWSSNGWLELQWYLFGATFMMCSAWTWKNNGHVRIDVISSRLKVTTRNRLELLGHLAFMMPFLAVLLYLTPGFVLSTYRSGEVSSSVGGLIIWPAKALIMAGFYLLALQWCSEVIKRVAIMRGVMPDEGDGGGHQSGAQEEAKRLLAALAAEANRDQAKEDDRNNSPSGPTRS